MLLYASIHVIGIAVCFPSDRVQRKTFRETRMCVESRLKMQRENSKQVKRIVVIALLYYYYCDV
jgi:hypothetical protein